MPAITIGMNYAMAYVFIWWDKHGKQETKCDTIQSYVALYGGQPFSVHVRYSNMLNILFMTMMYGAALPLLYPIAMFSFAVLYVQDITLLVYFAEAPPSYDNDLNTRFISIIQKSPILLLGMAFWQLTNQELLPYDTAPLEFIHRLNETRITRHRWYDYFHLGAVKLCGPALPVFILFWVYVIYFGVSYLSKIFKCWKTLKLPKPIQKIMDLFKIDDVEIVENLDDYAHSLEEDDIDWLVREVNYYKTYYGLSLKSDKTIVNLNNAAEIEVPKRHI